MDGALAQTLLWFAAVGCGVMAGVYFTFSAFAMRALGEIAPEAGAAAMQSINRVIVRSAFLPLFFATTLAAAALAVLAGLNWGDAGSAAALAGGVVYVFGMFVVTVALNIPLNNALERADPASDEGRAVWARYLTTWTARNHIRTLASTAACALFIAALTTA